jgi:hypothetical protein
MSDVVVVDTVHKRVYCDPVSMVCTDIRFRGQPVWLQFGEFDSPTRVKDQFESHVKAKLLDFMEF